MNYLTRTQLDDVLEATKPLRLTECHLRQVLGHVTHEARLAKINAPAVALAYAATLTQGA